MWERQQRFANETPDMEELKTRLQMLISNMPGNLCSSPPGLVSRWLQKSVTPLLPDFAYIPIP